MTVAGCSVIGFVLCTIPKIHYHILLVSTAFVGSSALMLGVDCFTTAGLKEASLTSYPCLRIMYSNFLSLLLPAVLHVEPRFPISVSEVC